MSHYQYTIDSAMCSLHALSASLSIYANLSAASEQNKPIVTEPKNNIQNTNYSIQLKLQELEQIYKNNLITEEEYENKRKEILDKL